ncbi:PAS domain-containing protein [Aurantiacibacter sp. MUD11]|uniref:PAS domain-containing protein n=1 Tax=Aurantiacibacter sp. MUD11 TaxID=3003265 RepID=UPI0022AA9758|nr:PAS domain-containing protein [Aurantiacibacter sp. MUD11]WAT16940.1 PAS domain-containing protein [Aurantiacibacter sp. MUD11]
MNLYDPQTAPNMSAPRAEFDDEAKRLEVVESFEAEELTSDPELQAIVDFAAQLCGAPVSVVTLLEENQQRFLARKGTEETRTPRGIAFCNHTLGSSDLLEVMDATADERFADNPLVTDPPDIRYYAGQPLVSEEGASLGTLCVIDTKPHAEPLNDFQRRGLEVLAQAALRRLEARRSEIRAQQAIAEREERLRRMIEGVPQIAWSANAEGNFDYFNRRWEERTGAPPPKLADDWRPFVHPDDADEVFAEWERCFAAGEEFESEYRLRMADGRWEWVLSLAVPVSESAGDPVRWFGTLTDIDEVRSALEERDLLAKELSHRIKNIFAVVIGLATLKARKTPEHEPFARDLTQVLRALGRAHEFVRPHQGPVQDSLHGLLASLFSPYDESDGQPRVRVNGFDTPVCARAATPLALVFHELATNSAKYGALSNDAGYVELDAEDRGDAIALTWREHGGPQVEDDGIRGFGSRLVEMSVTGQLQGTWDRHFEPNGLVVELTMAKTALAD